MLTLVKWRQKDTAAGLPRYARLARWRRSESLDHHFGIGVDYGRGGRDQGGARRFDAVICWFGPRYVASTEAFRRRLLASTSGKWAIYGLLGVSKLFDIVHDIRCFLSG
jgi:hypothetical protein